MSSKKGGSKNDASDKNAQALRDIQARCAENKLCFECRQRGPTYVDMTIGSFVCSKCSGVLRGITPPHRIKSISMSSFSNEEIESIRTRGNAYNAKVWLGLYDFKTRISLDTKDDESIREFIVQKYEKKRYYVDPSHVRHTVEPEPEKAPNGPLHSPPSKFSSGLIGSTLLMHKSSTTPPATAAIAKPSATATPPAVTSIKMTPPPSVASERASTSSSSSLTSPPPLPSVSLSKPSPFAVLSTPPVQQNIDPFGQPATMNDFFGGKNDSFANFDSANIYSNPTSNPLSTKASHSAQINFGLSPIQSVPLSAAAAPAPAQAIQEAKKPIMSTQQEDKYAALKDLDNIFKTSVELSKPALSEPEPFPQAKPASNTSSNRTYNPFAADFASSQQLNTSPWPTTGSPSGPGFASASGGFGGAAPAKVPDFFPSPWDAPAASAASNTTDFFGSKNFNNPWSENSDNDQFGQFGFNKKNPFL